MTVNDPHNRHAESSARRKTSPLIRWRCPNCGQTHFTAPDEEPPDICAYCCDMTTWERVTHPDNS